MQRLIFKKLELWIVLLILTIGLLGTVLFGAAVKYHAEGRRRAGFIGEDDLTQLVQDFAGQHEKQAAALQAQLQHLETQVGLLTTQYAIIAADYKALAAVLPQV